MELKTNSNGITYSDIITSFLFILILATTLGVVTIDAAQPVGTATILFVLGASNIFLVSYIASKKVIMKIHLPLIFSATLFLLINVVGIYNNPNSRAFIIIFQFLTLINFAIAMSLFKWDRNKIKLVSGIAAAFILIITIHWAITGFPIPFSSFYLNPNVLAPIIFYLSFFMIAYSFYKKRKLGLRTIILMSLVLIYASSSRSIMVSLFVLLVTYILWKFISKNKFRFYSFFVFIVALAALFTFLYPFLPYWEHFAYFQTLSFEYTGKSLMSGRETLWSDIIYLIGLEPLFGYGSGTLPADLLSYNQSSHNLYLQIALQNGYLGLIALVIALFTVWNMFWKNRENKIVQLSASFFISILIYQLFEVSLLQNNLSIALLQWLIIAVGLSQCIYKRHLE